MKKKNLIIFFTSLQTPIPEININFFLKNKKKFKNIYFVNCFSNAPLRIDYTILHGSLRKFISQFLRNGIFKKIKYLYNINKIRKKYNYIKQFTYKKKVDFNQISNIFDKYSHKELNTIKKYFCQFSGYSILNNLNYIKINKILETLKWSELNTIFFLKDQKIKKNESVFLLHNGYHPIEKGIFNIIKKENKLITENNGYLKKYLVRKYGFHELKTFFNEIIRFYNSKQNKSFFYKNAISLIKKKKNHLEKNTLINLDKKKIILFLTSSINEFNYTYENPTNQIKILNKILENNEINKNYNLLVRVHPNCINYSNYNKNVWDLLKYKYPKNIISYNEKVNTYKLIEKSKLTMSIGSVTGLESILLGKNHILFGDQSMWSKLQITNNLKENFSEKKLLNLIDFLASRKITKFQRNMAGCAYLYEYIYGSNFHYPLWSKYPYSNTLYENDFKKILNKLK